MATYYNEFDAFAAQWLRELIKRGLIADGEVDDRSIEDVTPNDLKEFKQCHFFAGIGVWSYALRKAGWCDEREVWTGSCPCQPFSSAGKGTGFADERHLWPAFHYLIEQCRPSVVLGEQVASSDALPWIDLVQTDLEATNYSFGAADLCAAGFDIPQIRQRLFWVANTNDKGPQRYVQPVNVDDSQRWKIARQCFAKSDLAAPVWDGKMERGADGIFREACPDLRTLPDEFAARVGLLRGYGNAINEEVARTFIKAVMEII